MDRLVFYLFIGNWQLAIVNRTLTYYISSNSSIMSAYTNSNTYRAVNLLNSAYPSLDDQTSAYIAGILDCPEDLQTEDDLFASVGVFIQEYAPDVSEDNIRNSLKQVYDIISSSDLNNDHSFTLLESPKNLKNKNKINSSDNNSNGIMQQDHTHVDKKKLEEEEEKIKQKQLKRDYDDTVKATKNAQKSAIPMQPTLNQVTIRNANSTTRNNWKDIHLEGIDLSYAGVNLLESADLNIVKGRRYGLVGRNGVGKTSLLRAMADGGLKLPGGLRIVHVEQEIVGDETICLDTVLTCDVERARLLNVEQQLMNSANSDMSCEAVDYRNNTNNNNSNDTASIISNDMDHEVGQHSSPILNSKSQGNVNRTGKGGKEKISSKFASKKPANTTAQPSIIQQNHSFMSLSDIQAQLLAIEADKAPARAAAILSGLGFTQQMQKGPTSSLSGGWRMRLALAGALFACPELLLLDEPTNMLDIKAELWLEAYLQNWTNSLLIVSHDRTFLDQVITDVLYLRDKNLNYYKGNYSMFEKAKEDRLKQQQREYEANEMKREHLQAFVDRWRVNANRASQAQSKLKVLEKLPNLRPIEKETEVMLKFPLINKLSPPVLCLQDVTFAYQGQEQPLFSNITLNADTESRIALIGENGAGKTTLLKILMGELEPLRGERVGHRHLNIGYFAQHHVDSLTMDLTPVELLASILPALSQERYRWELGAFGLSGDITLRPTSTLSGGQKSRLSLALICAKKPNFLFLDEPTNHLDVETVQALGHAITHYRGGIILVSHDESLVKSCCKEVWLVKRSGSGLEKMEGGIEQYKKALEKEITSYLI